MLTYAKRILDSQTCTFIHYFHTLSYPYRTRDAPTPPIISMNSGPLIARNGTSASVATALASIVLPHPGGPNKRAPLGTYSKQP